MTTIGRPADGLAQPAHTEAPDLAAALDAIDLQLVTDSPEVVLPRDAAVLVACALQDLPDLLAQAWDEGHDAGCADPYKPYGECGCGPNPYKRPEEGR